MSIRLDRLAPPAQVLFAVLALPALVRAAWHLRRLSHERNLQKLTDGMRQGRPFRSPFLRAPLYHAALAERLVRWLPPRAWGPCLKKSLLLLELWTRCGLNPTLHLGAQIQGPRHDFHAWIQANDLQHGRGRHEELWSG
jgi:hypothetical protein